MPSVQEAVSWRSPAHLITCPISSQTRVLSVLWGWLRVIDRRGQPLAAPNFTRCENLAARASDPLASTLPIVGADLRVCPKSTALSDWARGLNPMACGYSS